MGWANFANPFKNNIGNALKNIFKGPTQQTQQQVSFGGVQPISGYNFQPYQVKPGDTFDTIAKNSGLDVPSIQQANNGMLVPTPKGSYINLPAKPQNSLGPVYGPPTPLGYGAPVGYGPYYQNRQPTTTTAPGVGPNSFTSAGGQINTAELSAHINTQVAAGQLPGSVSVYTPIIDPTTGKPVTDQQMVANGYQYDNIKKEWQLPGAAPSAQPAGQVTNAAGTGSSEFMNTGFMQQYAAQGTAFVNQKRWDPETKQFVRIGDLLRQGKLSIDGKRPKKKKNRRQEEAPVYIPPPDATNSGGNPSQNLNTNVGGG
jgi:LysM repeat protein